MLDSFCPVLGRRRRSSVPYLVTTRAFLLECTIKQLRPVSQVKGPWGQRRRCAPTVAHVLQRTIRRHDRTPRGKPSHAPANSNCLRLEFEKKNRGGTILFHMWNGRVWSHCVLLIKRRRMTCTPPRLLSFPAREAISVEKRDVSCRLHVPWLPCSPAASSCVFVVFSVWEKKFQQKPEEHTYGKTGLAETAARTSRSLRLRESFGTCAWKGLNC